MDQNSPSHLSVVEAKAFAFTAKRSSLVMERVVRAHRLIDRKFIESKGTHDALCKVVTHQVFVLRELPLLDEAVQVTTATESIRAVSGALRATRASLSELEESLSYQLHVCQTLLNDSIDFEECSARAANRWALYAARIRSTTPSIATGDDTLTSN
jgi:hypothetical protein